MPPELLPIIRAGVKVERCRWRYVIRCQHAGCWHYAEYSVTYGGGRSTDRCFTHLKEDFGASKLTNR